MSNKRLSQENFDFSDSRGRFWSLLKKRPKFRADPAAGPDRCGNLAAVRSFPRIHLKCRLVLTGTNAVLL